MEALRSLVSTVIGKITIWIIIALLAVIVVMYGRIYFLNQKLKVEVALKDGITYALSAQSQMIDTNRADYEHNLADANKTNTVIKTRYIVKTKNIIEWRDTNVTCDDAMSKLNNYSF